MEQNIRFGCIADDFTGASDAASFLVRGGANTLLFNGVPAEDTMIPEGTDAVVIALKTRTEETKKAVEESLHALQWLISKNTMQFYVKYCSTFDSTPKGNIGPICDAFLQMLDVPYTLLCPSLPINKRTVQSGHLLVDQIPLNETHMRHHPLTPMWDSYIPNLMREQSEYPSVVFDKAFMKEGRNTIFQEIDRLQEMYERFYLVPEYQTDEDAKRIMELFGSLKLLTGGSGLMEELGKKISGGFSSGSSADDHIGGKALMMAGSCSVATQAQVQHFLSGGGYGITLSPSKLLSGEQTAAAVWEEILRSGRNEVLVYSSGSYGERDNSAGANEAEADILERTMADLAKRAVQDGFGRMIVAGGETSGAVTKALGYNAYRIGESIAPGVPVMTPLSAHDKRIVLKSGNFGQEDFFERTLLMTGVAQDE